MDETSRRIFAENLRRLVRARGNIADVCRRLGINRQQFNKYLSAKHVPSQANINAICDFFRITYRNIISEDMEIPELRRPADYLRGFRAFENAGLLQAALAANDTKRLTSFCGTYLKYHYSSIYKGDIVRAVTAIRPVNDVFGYVNLERFPNRNRQMKHDYVFKYHGFVAMIDRRLYMMDLESLQRNEITFSIYTPIARNPIRLFFGVTGGVASNIYREPYASRSVLQLVSTNPPTRTEYRKATVIAPDDPSIPVEALEYLNASGPR